MKKSKKPLNYGRFNQVILGFAPFPSFDYGTRPPASRKKNLRIRARARSNYSKTPKKIFSERGNINMFYKHNPMNIINDDVVFDRKSIDEALSTDLYDIPSNISVEEQIKYMINLAGNHK